MESIGKVITELIAGRLLWDSERIFYGGRGATAANQYEGGWQEGGRGPANTAMLMTKGSKDQARGVTLCASRWK